MKALPEALISQILSHLYIEPDKYCYPDTSRRPAALYAVSQVSKTLNRLAEPFLYKTIDLIGDGGVGPLCRIIESLLTRPRRQQHVQNVYMGDPQDRLDVYSDAVSIEFQAHLLAAIDNLDLSEELRKELAEAMRVEADAWAMDQGNVTVLLCICPNLRSWHFEVDSLESDTLLMRVLAHSGRSASNPAKTKPLQRLEDISLWNAFAVIQDLAPLLELPSLNSCFIAPVGATFEEYPAFTSRVTTLSLCDIDRLDDEDVRKIFACFPFLKSLALHSRDNVYDARLDDAPVDIYRRIGDALRECAAALTSLDLEISQAADNWEHTGSLSDLTCLTSLTIPLAFFMSRDERIHERHLVDILPTNLRELCVFECSYRLRRALDAQILELLADKRFHGLRTLRMTCAESFHGDLQSVGWSLAERTPARGTAIPFKDCFIDREIVLRKDGS